jgi:branched-chain amino acid transport system permease protein
MNTFASICIDGVAYGMILFMISVGLSVTMGLMRVVNLAHGGFAMLGGALAHYGMAALGLNFAASALLAILVVVALSAPMERLLYRPLYRMGELQQVLATIGITFLMIASVSFWLGTSILPIRLPAALSGAVNLGFRTLPMDRVFVIFVGLAIIGGLYMLIERTRFGVKLRAAVDERDAAACLGIDTSRIFSRTFALGAALAALGGIMGAGLLPIDAYYPLRYMVLFLVVVAVGGLGSIAGSFVAALGLGVLDTAARYLLPDYGTIFFYVAMIVVLGWRPHGLLGRAET